MSTIQTNAIVDAAGGNTATVNGISPLANSARFARNLIINGDFQVAQRGTSHAYSNNGSGYHTLDRWYSANFSSGTLTLSQQTTALGTVDSTNYLRAVTASTVGASATVYSSQKIENIKQFHNKSITVSFMVKASAALTFQLRRQYNYGSGGSSEEYTGFTDVSVTTGWTKFTTTFSAVDFSGKTIGANNFFGILFYWSTNQGTDQRNDATIEITNVQLETGSVATDFEHKTYASELTACQRYYQQLVGGSDQFTFPGKGQGSTTIDGTFPLAVPLRASPTMAAIASRFFSDDGFTSSTAAPAANQFSAGNCHLGLQIGSYSGGTAFANNHAGVWCPVSSTLKIDAEL
jgi:hypothetical protein